MSVLHRETDRDVARLLETLGTLPQPVAHPRFIVISGLPGTGKSHLAGLLAGRLHYLVLASDRLRKALFPRPGYQPEESARLFHAIHYLIEILLNRGISLTLDATNLSEHNREYLYNIADRTGARLILVYVEAPPETVRARLTSRGPTSRNASDADWSVYEKMKSEVQKIKRHHLVVDTSQDIEPAIEKIIHEAEGGHRS